MITHRLAALCASLLFLAGCGCLCSDEAEKVWAPVTTPHDPECEGCRTIEIEDLGGHGVDAEFLINPDVDDELMQWARCLHGYMDCIDEGGEDDDCIDSAPCPRACKDEYAQLAANATDLEGKFAAIDATFFDEGARCNAMEVSTGGARP